MGRLKKRLDAIQADAHGTMSDARSAIALAEDLLADIQDGVTFRLVRTGENTIMDFLTGQCDELPIEIKLDLKD